MGPARVWERYVEKNDTESIEVRTWNLLNKVYKIIYYLLYIYIYIYIITLYDPAEDDGLVSFWQIHFWGNAHIEYFLEHFNTNLS